MFPTVKRPKMTGNQAMSIALASQGYGADINKQSINQPAEFFAAQAPQPTPQPYGRSYAGQVDLYQQMLQQYYRGGYEAFNPTATGQFKVSSPGSTNVFDPETAPPPPEGATYDKYGRPYFGPGFEGWWKKFLWSVNGQKQSRDDQATFGDRVEGVWDAAWGSLFDVLGEPAIKTKQAVSLVEETERMGEEVLRFLPKRVRDFLDDVSITNPMSLMYVPMNTFQRGFTDEIKKAQIEALNEWSGQFGWADFGKVIDWGDNVLDTLTRFQDFFNLSPSIAATSMNPEFREAFTTKNKGQMLEGDLPGIDPDSRLNAAWNGGRILYTSILDPMVRAEYMREFMSGNATDPFLLYQNYENPTAELIGEIGIDPLNAVTLIPARMLKTMQRETSARRLFTTLNPGMEDIFRKSVDNLPTQERAWDNMDAAIKTQLVDQAQLAQGAADKEIDAWAKSKGLFGPGVNAEKRHGIFPTFNLTTTAKRTVIANSIGELTRSVSQLSAGDPDKFSDVMHAIYLLGSKDEAEIAEGLAIAMDFKAPRILLGRAGQYTSRVLRKMVGDDIDAFVRQGQNILDKKGLDEYLMWIDRRQSAALEEMIPSSNSRVAAQLIKRGLDRGTLKKGDSFSYVDIARKIDDETIEWANEVTKLGNINWAEQRALDLHNMLHPFYAGLNNFFSTIYMGLSPRYAIRNMINNYFTTAVDEGLGAVFGSHDDAIVGLEKILGWIPEGARRGITGAGPAAGLEGIKEAGAGKRWLKFGQKWAEKFESNAAAQVTYVAVSRALHQMIQPGKALPDLRALTDAGLSQDFANRIVARIVENNYNVKPVIDEVMQALSSGQRLRSATEWMSPTMVKQLKDFGIYDMVVEETRKATTKQEALEGIKRVRDRVRRYADRVDDMPHATSMNEQPGIEGGWVSLAAEYDRMFGEASNLAQNAKGFRDANVGAANAIYSLLETMGSKVALTNDPKMAKIWSKITEVVRHQEATPYAHVFNIVKDAVLNFKQNVGKMSDAEARSAFKALWDMQFPDDLRANDAVAEMLDGMKDMFMPGEVLSRKNLVGAAWETYFNPRMRYIWSSYVDNLYGQLLDLSSRINAANPELLQDLAPKMEEVMTLVNNAKTWEAWSASEEWVRLFSGSTPESKLAMLAKEFGLGSVMEYGGGRRGADITKRVLNIINGNMPEQYKVRFPHGFGSAGEAAGNPSIVYEALTAYRNSLPPVAGDTVVRGAFENNSLRSRWRSLSNKRTGALREKRHVTTYKPPGAERDKKLADLDKEIADWDRQIAEVKAQIDQTGGLSNQYVPGKRVVVPGLTSYNTGGFAYKDLDANMRLVLDGNVRFLPDVVRESAVNALNDVSSEAHNFVRQEFGHQVFVSAKEGRVSVGGGHSGFEQWYRDLPAGHYIDRKGNKIKNTMDALAQMAKDLEQYGTLRKRTAFTNAVMKEALSRMMQKPELAYAVSDSQPLSEVLNKLDDVIRGVTRYQIEEELSVLGYAAGSEAAYNKLMSRLTKVVPGERAGDIPYLETPDEVEGAVEHIANGFYTILDSIYARGEEIPQEVAAHLGRLEKRIGKLQKKYGVAARQGKLDVVSVAAPDVLSQPVIYHKGAFEYELDFNDEIERGLYILSNPKVKGEERARLVDWLKDMTDAGEDDLKKMADEIKEMTRIYMREQFPVKPRGTYVDGLPPNGPQVMRGSEKVLNKLFDRIEAGVGRNFGAMDYIIDNPEIRDALKKWFDVAEGRVGEARLIASQMGNAARDFALHDYRLKNSADLLFGYLYPYSFWYTRTYNNWMRRLAYNPAVMAGYAKYKDYMAKIHAGAPDWWKYNININEMLGIESDSPLYFNLESNLWPLYALTGTDFNDPKKRYNMVSTVMDSVDNFGPSPWTLYGTGLAIAAKAKGDDEAAARWGGRLLPMTKDLRNMFALAGMGNVDIDPFVQAFSNGVDPYDLRLASRALAWMQDEGKYTPEEIADAGRSHAGPVWEEAIDRAIKYRAGSGQTGAGAAMLFGLSQLGIGFKARTPEDMAIDMYDKDVNRLYTMKDNLSPTEYANSQDALKVQYPFSDVMVISRGSDEQRDEFYSYNVLSRIPPGQRDNVFEVFGLTYDMVQEFYDSKGDALTGRKWRDASGQERDPWTESDRNRFMAAVLDIGTVLRLPDDVTRLKWREATYGYGNMRDAMQKVFGEDIHEKVNAYYMAKDQGAGDSFLQAHPEIGSAMDFKTNWMIADETMTPYYSSIQAIEIYYANLKRKAIEDEAVAKFGTTPMEAWAGYDEAQLSGTQREYWLSNPVMEWMMDQGEYYDAEMAKRLISIESKLKAPQFPGIRESLPEALSDQAMALTQYVDESQRGGYYDMSIDELTQGMSPSLANIVMDSLESGEDLPSAAAKQVDYLAEQLGIYNRDLYLELIRSKMQ